MPIPLKLREDEPWVGGDFFAQPRYSNCKWQDISSDEPVHSIYLKPKLFIRKWGGGVSFNPYNNPGQTSIPQVSSILDPTFPIKGIELEFATY